MNIKLELWRQQRGSKKSSELIEELIIIVVFY